MDLLKDVTSRTGTIAGTAAGTAGATSEYINLVVAGLIAIIGIAGDIAVAYVRHKNRKDK